MEQMEPFLWSLNVQLKEIIEDRLKEIMDEQFATNN